MKKIILFLVIFLSFSAFAQEEVLLDVGHNPKAPGAISGSGIPEYFFNENLVNKIDYYLNNAGVTATIFDDKTSTKKLSDRTKGHYHLFFSLHHDSMPLHMWNEKEKWKGFSLFVSQKNPEYQKSLQCALILGKNLVDAGFTPSLFHGLPISNENRTILSSQYGVHEYTNLVVLKTAQTPALLMEAGVIINSEEEALRDSDRQNKMSFIVAQSLKKCLETF